MESNTLSQQCSSIYAWILSASARSWNGRTLVVSSSDNERKWRPPGRRDQTDGWHAALPTRWCVPVDGAPCVNGAGGGATLASGSAMAEYGAHEAFSYCGSGQTPGWPVSFSICTTAASSSRTSLG
jgi:hypothetical protein